MRQTISISLVAGLVTIGLLAGAVAGCDDPTITEPASLEAPVAMEVVEGAVCLPDVVRDDATIGTGPLPACEEGGNGFGLVVNQRSDRLAVVSLGQDPARTVNLDARRPGVTHIPVGARPVDVTTTGGGTAAIVADQRDRTLTGVDLWTMRPLDERRDVEGTLVDVETLPDGEESDLVATLTRGPDRLELFGGLDCDQPDGVDDRRDHDPADNCVWGEPDAEGLDLPGRPVDMEVDEAERRAWIVYRDLNELSWYAFDDEGLGDDECMLAGAEPPCEVDRVGWQQHQEATDGVRGATDVDVGPLGLFVYVLDRPGNRLFVFDRQRRTLIDASAAVEPPLTPLETTAHIPLVSSPTALSADVDRLILGDGHVRYLLGARVAANNGQLYRVGAADIECVFEEQEPIDTNTFLHDRDAREETAEANCLHLPEFPLGGDPDFDDDDELLDHRVVDDVDDANLAITPVFGLRDADGRDGGFVGATQCEQPGEFLDALRNVEDGEGIGCESPLSPQPVAPQVDDDLETYEDEPPAALMTFARAIFDEDDGLAAAIERLTYDLRLATEGWSVTYEGALPGVGDRRRGLVSSDEEGRFVSGGLDYCSAGVETGDRLRIISDPADDDACETFEGDPEYRTWEIVDVEPFEVELAVVDDGDRVDELPNRTCFREGLAYEIRATDEWLVVGDDTGLVSPRERDGEECVLRPGADQERSRMQSRVETGEGYLGPYKRFRLREGAVEPVEDLEYTFDVRRRFALDSESHVPEDNGSTLPAQVVATPDLGAGRTMAVVDAGGDRIFVRNLTFADAPTQFVR